MRFCCVVAWSKPDTLHRKWHTFRQVHPNWQITECSGEHWSQTVRLKSILLILKKTYSRSENNHEIKQFTDIETMANANPSHLHPNYCPHNGTFCSFPHAKKLLTIRMANWFDISIKRTTTGPLQTSAGHNDAKPQLWHLVDVLTICTIFSHRTGSLRMFRWDPGRLKRAIIHATQTTLQSVILECHPFVNPAQWLIQVKHQQGQLILH